MTFTLAPPLTPDSTTSLSSPLHPWITWLNLVDSDKGLVANYRNCEVAKQLHEICRQHSIATSRGEMVTLSRGIAGTSSASIRWEKRY